MSCFVKKNSPSSIFALLSPLSLVLTPLGSLGHRRAGLFMLKLEKNNGDDKQCYFGFVYSSVKAELITISATSEPPWAPLWPPWLRYNSTVDYDQCDF